MANEMTIPNDFGQVPDIFKGPDNIDGSRFTAGIGMAWPILTLRGKEWGWRFRGVDRAYTAPDASAGGAQMPVRALDVVIVDAANRISKVYYEKGFVPNERTPPTCWSADGVTPDGAVPDEQKQNGSCRACKWNVFGSKMGDGGQKGKACSDNKRLAVVTLNDLENIDFGGPFMLRLPPGSFSNYTTYVSVMAARGFQPYMIVTRLMFGPEAHPKVIFQPVRALTNLEAAIVKAHQQNPRTSEMLNDKAVGAFMDPEAVDDEGVIGTLPVANDAGTPTSGWTKPEPQPEPKVEAKVEAKPTLTPAEQKIADLEAQLAAAKTPKVEPKPEPVLTPEEIKIRDLEAQLAAAKTAKPRGRPRSKPVAPPEGTVTATGNGAAPDEPKADPVGNALSDRIAMLKGQTPQ